MQILIFEGIATSGKTALISALSECLTGNVLILGEPQTHLPIMEKKTGLHLGFFEELIKSSVKKNPDIIIFDRLYLTQAFRAKKKAEDYKQVEDFLLKYLPITIFLTINEDNIVDRIAKAMEHREPRWSEYLKTKGESIEEISRYYIEQQRGQLELLKQSRIPYKIFDTTAQDYEKIALELKKLIQ